MLNSAIRIGRSDWNDRHWRGAFTPEKPPVKRWFQFHAPAIAQVGTIDPDVAPPDQAACATLSTEAA